MGGGTRSGDPDARCGCAAVVAACRMIVVTVATTATRDVARNATTGTVHE